MDHPLGRDISHIKVTAVLAVLVLVGAGIWETVQHFETRGSSGTFVATTAPENGAQNAAVATDTLQTSAPTDPISAVSTNALGEVVGAYTGLEESGQYSSSSAASMADSIGMGLAAPISYTQMNASNVKTSPETSYTAMMAYRAALQTSLKPLLNNTEPEYELFGMYVETKQQTYLDQLSAAAANYQAAASSTAEITVPVDAVQVQLGLVNSMNEFAADLDALVVHADDPVASSVLLENYDQGENDVLTAFQNLVTYEQSKTQ